MKLNLSVLCCWFYSLLSCILSQLSCPHYAERYANVNQILAIENHSYYHLSADVLDGVEGALPDLESFVLRDTGIRLVAPGAFVGIRMIDCIDLSRNQIELIENPVFAGLKLLETLILSNNQLDTVGQSAFIYIKTLRRLDLSGNRITQLPDSAFRGLENLQELYMDSNRLTYLSTLLFYHTPNLKRLHVSNNPLFYVGIGNIATLTDFECRFANLVSTPKFGDSLIRLDASSNNISLLTEATSVKLSMLSEVFLSNNPWNCSCVNIPFLKWANHTSSLVDRSNMNCFHPLKLRGIDFDSALRTLDCSDEATVFISTGVNVTETTGNRTETQRRNANYYATAITVINSAQNLTTDESTKTVPLQTNIVDEKPLANLLPPQPYVMFVVIFAVSFGLLLGVIFVAVALIAQRCPHGDMRRRRRFPYWQYVQTPIIQVNRDVSGATINGLVSSSTVRISPLSSDVLMATAGAAYQAPRRFGSLNHYVPRNLSLPGIDPVTRTRMQRQQATDGNYKPFDAKISSSTSSSAATLPSAHDLHL